MLTLQVGAAVLGVAVKPTIKEVDGDGNVVKTLQRSRLVEVQTPQVLPSLPPTFHGNRLHCIHH